MDITTDKIINLRILKTDNIQKKGSVGILDPTVEIIPITIGLKISDTTNIITVTDLNLMRDIKDIDSVKKD